MLIRNMFMLSKVGREMDQPTQLIVRRKRLPKATARRRRHRIGRDTMWHARYETIRVTLTLFTDGTFGGAIEFRILLA